MYKCRFTLFYRNKNFAYYNVVVIIIFRLSIESYKYIILWKKISRVRHGGENNNITSNVLPYFRETSACLLSDILFQT